MLPLLPWIGFIIGACVFFYGLTVQKLHFIYAGVIFAFGSLATLALM